VEPVTTVATSRAETGGRATLALGRARAHEPEEIGAALVLYGVSQRLASRVEMGLEEVIEAMRVAFPDNLFGDLDAYAVGIAREASTTADADAHVGRVVEETVQLMRLFGRETPIRFRYVHDFVYGFDWSRWVRKDPEARAATGPFDLAFLSRMRRRGDELLSLIEADDEKYPRLEGDAPRNPFGFSREPADERRLLTDLATQGLLPVAAWDMSAAPSWKRPFSDLRAQRALALGLR
jgi:hypothetical protein